MHKIGYKDIYDSILFVQRSLEQDKKSQIVNEKRASTIDQQLYLNEPDNKSVCCFVNQLVDCHEYYFIKEKKITDDGEKIEKLKLKRELSPQYNTQMGITHQLYTDNSRLISCVASICDYLGLQHYEKVTENTKVKIKHKSNVLFRKVCKLIDYIIIMNIASKKFNTEQIPVKNIKNSVAKTIFEIIHLKEQTDNLKDFKKKHDAWRNVFADYYTNLYLVECCINVINNLKKTSVNNIRDIFPYTTTVTDFYKQIDVSYTDMCKDILSEKNTANRIDKVNYGNNNQEFTIIDFISGGNCFIYGNLPTQDSRILQAFNVEIKKYFPSSIFVVPSEITDNGKNLCKYKFAFSTEDLSIITKQVLFSAEHVSVFARTMLTQLAGKMLLTRKFIAKASKSQDLDKSELVKIFNNLQKGFNSLFNEYLQCIDCVCFLYCPEYLSKLSGKINGYYKKNIFLQERKKLQEMYSVFRKIQSGLNVSQNEFENCFKKGSFEFKDINDKDINLFKIKEREEIYNEYYKTFIKATAPVCVITNSAILFFSSFSIQYSFLLAFLFTFINFLTNRIGIKENLNIVDISLVCYSYLKTQVEKISLIFTNNK